MRIRKTEQSVGILGKILNAFSNSNKDTYSSDYINKTYGGGVKNYSTEEVKLDEKWIDGKPIYRKVITTNAYNGVADWKEIANVPGVNWVIRMSALTYEQDSMGNYENTTSFPQYHSSWNGAEDSALYFKRSVGKLYEKHSYSYLNNKPLLIIMEYTKITD